MARKKISETARKRGARLKLGYPVKRTISKDLDISSREVLPEPKTLPGPAYIKLNKGKKKKEKVKARKPPGSPTSHEAKVLREKNKTLKALGMKRGKKRG